MRRLSADLMAVTTTRFRLAASADSLLDAAPVAVKMTQPGIEIAHGTTDGLSVSTHSALTLCRSTRRGYLRVRREHALVLRMRQRCCSRSSGVAFNEVEVRLNGGWLTPTR